MTKEQKLLERAKKLASAAPTWADFSNALYDPESGLLAKAYRDEGERAAFTKTPEYQEIRRLMAQMMRRTGVVEGATPLKSGRFVVRVPKSLHAALEREAADEGVSLNQLVVAKLAVGLKKIAS